MSDIIEFPKDKIVRNPSPEEAQRREGLQDSIYYKNIDLTVKKISNDLYWMIKSDDGLNTIGEQFESDFGFVEDAIQALVYRQHNIEHHLHDIINGAGIKFIPDPDFFKGDPNDPNTDPEPTIA